MIVTGWAYLSLISIESTLLNEDYYDDLLSETELVYLFYEELKDSFVDIVTANILADMDQVALSVFMENEILYQYSMNAFLEVIEPAWIEKQLDQNLKGILAFIRGDQEDLDIVLNMDEIEGDFRQKVLSEILDLSIEQIKKLGDHTNRAVVEARSARVIRDLGFFKQIRLTQLQHNIPEELENALKIYQNYKTSAYYISYIIFGFALLLMMLIAKPAKGFIWFGGATIFISLSFLLGLQLAKNYLPGILLSGIHDSGLPLSMDLIQLVVSHIVESINNVVLIAVVLGLVFLLLGLIWVLIIYRKNTSLSAVEEQSD